MSKSLKKSTLNHSQSPDANSLFVSNFKFLLQCRQVSQADVLLKTDITPSELKRVRTGKSRESVTVLLRISAYFGVSLDALLRQDISKANGGHAVLPQNLLKNDQFTTIELTKPLSPELDAVSTRAKLYEWLVTKGCRIITASKEKFERFIDGAISHLDIAATEQFDQQSSIVATFSLSRMSTDKEPQVHQIFAKLSQLDGPIPEIQHTFYAPESDILNLKEVFNLLSGRCVHKKLNPAFPNPLSGWLQINFYKPLSQYQFELEKYGSKYGFDLEPTLRFYNIVECKTQQGLENLITSLNEGNKVLVAIETSKGVVPKYIEANPASRVLRITQFSQ